MHHCLRIAILAVSTILYLSSHVGAKQNTISTLIVGKLVNCDPKKDWSNCFGFLESGSTWYNGEFQNGKPTGFGTVKYNSGNLYVGMHSNGLRNGLGMFKGSDGGVMLGVWTNGNKIDGHGVEVKSNGDKYIGNFKDGIRSGWGTYTHGYNTKWRGYKYIGEFKDNKYHGSGVVIKIKYDNFTVVSEGIWENHKLKSNQKVITDDLEKFSSQIEIKENEQSICTGSPILFSQNKIHETWNNCEGIIFYDQKFEVESVEFNARNDAYSGNFKDGLPHGNGFSQISSGNKPIAIYKGNFANGELNGNGEELRLKGCRGCEENHYNGNFKDNLKSGFGLLVFGDNQNAGWTYKGNHRDGIRHGEGRLTHIDGQELCCEFENGLAVTEASISDKKFKTCIREKSEEIKRRYGYSKQDTRALANQICAVENP